MVGHIFTFDSIYKRIFIKSMKLKFSKSSQLKVSEHDIQSAILNVLPYYSVYAWRNNSGMIAVGEGKYRRMIKMGKAGLPDIIGVQKKTGRMVAIEVKRPGNKPTELQEQVMSELKEHGAIVFVATSVDDLNQLKEKRNV